jgi:hypothetical protein
MSHAVRARRSIAVAILLPLFTLPGFSVVPDAFANDSTPFAVEVLDEATGRGVPLVELETINHLKFVTDSNGLVAISEPDLWDRNVYFTVRSHGYEFPKDGFGSQGRTLKVRRGGKETLKIKRVNIAERLYRVTGGGIYRDTVLLGGKSPIDNPLMKADVIGCDSAMTAVYRGKIHWFWGDTSRPHYPLGGNFHITGGTSHLPEDGGLDPGTGVNVDYFVGADGAVRPTAEMPGEGPTWISAVTVMKDPSGQERMYAGYVKIRNMLESYQWGFVVWNDDEQRFEKLTSFDKKPTVFLEPQTHSFSLKDGETDYIYFTNPLPLTRVKADPAAFVDPRRYEGFTCLNAGTVAADRQLDRDAKGRLLYSWKANTPFLTLKDQTMLVEAGTMRPDETLVALRDVDSGRELQAHTGSVYWNEYRKRWILVCVELNGGSSMLGELWFAEADAPTGPWVYARKIVTHDKYTFYNPKHHPFFDQDGGRTIYFEGTYTHSFSGNPEPTPRYDYNQVMYRLDLSASPLNLPVAFSEMNDVADGPSFAAAGPTVASTQPKRRVAFFGLPRSGTETVPIIRDGTGLKVGAAGADKAALFHALPANATTHPETTTPLYEYVHQATDDRVYSTDPQLTRPGYRRNAEPLCRVWKMPTRIHRE